MGHLFSSYTSSPSVLAEGPHYVSVANEEREDKSSTTRLNRLQALGRTIAASGPPSSEESRSAEAQQALIDQLLEIGRHCAALPVYDDRSPDEIVGYDDAGMWT